MWASGITVHDSVSTWDVPQGKGGRIIIDDHLRVDGLDSVFAVGDIAAPESSALPQLAQPAIQGGRYAAKTIEAALSGEDVEAFRYRDKGTMATIGRSAAVVQVNGLPPIKGFLAWTMSMGVHLFYLLGIRNRVATIVNLGSRYLFSHRGHNAIVGETRVSAKTDD